ncbi:MAG: Gfo/Idh/MocA family protein [Candidatus Binatia bacterium]
MRDDALRFGIVGAGGIAHSYALAFADCREAQLVAVSDVRPEAAQALAEIFECRSFTSHEEMASAVALDAVVICAPPVTHPDLTMSFLERHIHVLCEKPFSIDIDSARKMVETARRTRTRLTMASKFRFAEDVIRARGIVTSGILGEIVLFENAFTSRVDMRARWNADPVMSGGGVLIDNGTHSVDLMRYFLGPLAEVQVVEGKRVQNLPVEDTVRIFVRSVSGVMGSIDLSWSIDKELGSYLMIYGAQGTVSVGWKESKYRQSSSREWIVFGQGYDKIQAFRGQIENFCRAIRGEDKLVITPEDALASVEVIAAAYDALRRNQWTAVDHAADESPETVMIAAL